MNPYSRPPISISDQLAHLASKGLILDDEKSAARIIDEFGYYRLKAYMLPYRDASHRFYTNTSIQKIASLHDFDEALRLLVFRQIQRLEIGIRNRFNELMCDSTRNAFWYLDSSLFGRCNPAYADTVNKIRSAFLASQETFAKHFREKYYNDYCKFYSVMPPSWMAIELMTFGNMLTLLNAVDDNTISQYSLDRWTRKKVGPDKYKKLTNWLFCIRDVRNHCAHHSRLFNRNFPAPDGIRNYLDRNIELVSISGTRSPQVQLNRLYTALASLQVIAKKTGVRGIGDDLRALFSSYPEAKFQLNAMGFPTQWEEEKLFKY